MTTPLALSGIRVLDLTELLPGPFATQMLADMGAEIIKVERPGIGDNGRVLRPGTFLMVNRGKKSVTLNLKSEEGLGIFLRLAKDTDVLLEGYRPGVMLRLGIDYETISTLNRAIIYVSLSGFGQSGPLRDQPGHDLNYNAVAGVVALCGSPGNPPEHVVGVPLADLSGSLYAVTSVLAALMLRQTTGKGQYLDVSLTDTALSLVGPRLGAFQDTPGFSRENLLQRPGNAIYETKDKRYIAIGAIEDHFWKRLVKVLEVPALADRRYEKARERWSYAATIGPMVSARVRERTHDEWMRLLRDNDIPATTVSDLGSLFEHPQFKARGMFIQGEGIRYLNYPVPMAGADAARLPPAPALGAHTAEVLSAAGYSNDEIAALREKGVI